MGGPRPPAPAGADGATNGGASQTSTSVRGTAAGGASASDGAPPSSPPPTPAAPSRLPAASGRRKRRGGDGGVPLFAFDSAAPESPTSDSASNEGDSASNGGADTPTTAAADRRPKRKLKSIARYSSLDPHAPSPKGQYKHGEGFLCPRCGYVCSYDSRRCEECALECYYEAGVGVVTLKERRVREPGERRKVKENDGRRRENRAGRANKGGRPRGRPRGRPPKKEGGRAAGEGTAPGSRTDRSPAEAPSEETLDPAEAAAPKGSAGGGGAPGAADDARPAYEPPPPENLTPGEAAAQLSLDPTGAAANLRGIHGAGEEAPTATGEAGTGEAGSPSGRGGTDGPVGTAAAAAADRSRRPTSEPRSEAQDARNDDGGRDDDGTSRPSNHDGGGSEAGEGGGEGDEGLPLAPAQGAVGEGAASDGRGGPGRSATDPSETEGGAPPCSYRRDDEGDLQCAAFRFRRGAPLAAAAGEVEEEDEGAVAAVAPEGATSPDRSAGASSTGGGKEDAVGPPLAAAASTEESDVDAARPPAPHVTPEEGTMEGDSDEERVAVASAAKTAVPDESLVPELDAGEGRSFEPGDSAAVASAPGDSMTLTAAPKKVDFAAVPAEEASDASEPNPAATTSASKRKSGQKSKRTSNGPAGPPKDPPKRRARPPQLAAPRAHFWKGGNPRGRPSKQVVELREQLRAMTQSNLALTRQVGRLQSYKESAERTLRRLGGAAGEGGARKASPAARGESPSDECAQSLETLHFSATSNDNEEGTVTSLTSSDGGSKGGSAAADDSRAQYHALLSTVQDYRNQIAELKSAVRLKEQEVACARATHAALRGRVASVREDLRAARAERDRLARCKAASSSNGDPPRHLNMPEDVSNCSTEVEELQSKMEEEREEHVKELLCVQGQKDDLLVQLRDSRKEAKKRARELEAKEEQEALHRKKIGRLEGMVDVLMGQRDRASARVRQMLLSGGSFRALGEEEAVAAGGAGDRSTSTAHAAALAGGKDPRRAERVLASFQSESADLAARLQESLAANAVLESEKAAAVERSTELEGALEKLRGRWDAVQRGRDGFEAPFRMEHDECLRELENVNLSSNERDGEGCSLESLSESSAGATERGGADILAPPPPAAGEKEVPPSRRDAPLAAAATLDVPSLSEAEAEAEAEQDDKSTKVDELTDALGSLNDFENFLLDMDLGLEGEQQG